MDKLYKTREEAIKKLEKLNSPKDWGVYKTTKGRNK